MLKKYQSETLDVLTDFLHNCAVRKDVNRAYAESTRKNFGQVGTYNDASFTNIPYVCLRLPTGGGKTVLAAHSIPIACSELLARDFSLVIWLVPSNAILEQTYNCLQDSAHPYRIVLNEYFNGNVEVLKIEDARSVSKGTLQSNTVIVISTFASWRVDKTEGRKVYENSGVLEHHFTKIKQEKRQVLEHFDEANGKTLKYSLANVVYINNPIFIIDEAHNARTPLTFEVLKRLNPACIIEFTATPKTKGEDRSNVLYSVSASRLKAEDMIKMPIELLTKDNWQNTIISAVKKQEELEILTKQEESLTGEYIRPIVLLQAQHDSLKESTISTTEVKNFLMNVSQIPENQIAIATGTEQGIEGIDLSDSNCELRFIITKQALKEGWDCPFAYIFCSVANVNSSKDVEQLLGRVLRMPKVQRKSNEQLNRAYAFVSSNNFFNTANNLRDSLVQSGFTSTEVSDLLQISPNQLELGKFFGNVKIDLSTLPNSDSFSPSLRNKIVISKEDSSIILIKQITESEKDEIKASLNSEIDRLKVEKIYKDITDFHKLLISPSKKGIPFLVPQLLINFEDTIRVFDEDILLPSNWNLADCDYKLTDNEFPVKVDSGKKGLIDIDGDGNAVTYNASVIQEELSDLIISSTMDKDGLIQWLVRQARHQSISYAQTVVFVTFLVDNLVQSRELKVEHLVFTMYKLRDAVRNKILFYYKEAKKKGYEELLFSGLNTVKDKLSQFSTGEDFTFPELYPANNYYSGQFKFSKHYHSQVADMNEEESECALNIDMDNNVEFWIRNLDRQDNYAFWLQTSTDKFYPDFIVKLKDGIIVVVEYKGANIYDTTDSKEKRAIGEFYANVSGTKCRYIMLKGKDWNTLKYYLSDSANYLLKTNKA